MTQEQFYKIAGKIFSGEATPEEKELLDAWIAASERHWYEFEILRKSWEETHVRNRVSNQDKVFRNILSGIDDSHEKKLKSKESAISEQRHSTGILPMHNVVFRYAAAIVVILTALFVAVQIVPSGKDTGEDAVAMITKSNRAGQKSQIHLPDGTTVWLNAESVVTYPESFGSTVREVWLDGEAYFEVHKDKIKPLVVHTGQVSTQVVGTTFNVAAFPEEQTIRVSLTEGKVVVNIDSEHIAKEIPLDPGEQLCYNRAQQSYKKDTFDPLVTIGWKDGIIYFRKAGFEEVVKTLSRWYGVHFTIENAGLQPEWSYTGTFKNAYLDNILKNISFAKGFEYELRDKNVIIEFN